MAAGARVDGADVQAGAAADAVQRLAADLVGAARACGRCRAARRAAPAGRRPRVTPVQSDVYGFIRSPVEERGSSWRNTSRSANVGTSFSIPTTVTSTARQRRAHAAVALRLDDAERAGLGDAEVRAADADLGAQEPLAQVEARRLGQVARVVGGDARRDRAREEVADLGAVAVDRRHEDVRRPVAVELQDQLGEVGLERVDARRRRARRSGWISSVVSDFTFTTSVDAVRPRDLDDDRVRLGRVARPSAR